MQVHRGSLGPRDVGNPVQQLPEPLKNGTDKTAEPQSFVKEDGWFVYSLATNLTQL